MKAALLFLSAFLFGFTSSFAQDCQPNDTIPDSLLGVFPMPYDPVESPEGGIRDTACVGFEYSFVFTTVVGDSFTLGETTLPLDSLWLSKETAVANLPKGLDYACNPPTCVFGKNSKGCIIIYGTPAAGTEGKHQMKLSGKLYANGNSFGLPLTFPDPNIAPGEYTIVVAAKSESPCKQLGVDEFGLAHFEVYPNPAKGFVNIKSDESGNVELIDALGRAVVSRKIAQGENTLKIESAPSGVYQLIMTSDDDKMAIKKILIE
jgi:hypothetical protein